MSDNLKGLDLRLYKGWIQTEAGVIPSYYITVYTHCLQDFFFYFKKNKLVVYDMRPQQWMYFEGYYGLWSRILATSIKLKRLNFGFVSYRLAAFHFTILYAN